MLPTHDASKVKASGPGLNTTGVPASLPVEFTIDAKDAGEGLLAVQITVRCFPRLHCGFQYGVPGLLGDYSRRVSCHGNARMLMMGMGLPKAAFAHC